MRYHYHHNRLIAPVLFCLTLSFPIECESFCPPSINFHRTSRVFPPPPNAVPDFHVEAALDALKVQSKLPIFDVLKRARQSLQERPNLLLEAPPGAGKTTVLPLALLPDAKAWHLQDDATEEDDIIVSNLIIVVEPRRVAARAAAQRMASILQEQTGETVGYAVRGDARISKKDTNIICMTEGVLLNRLREDPELTGVRAIVFDEFHERQVGSDTALALSVEIQTGLRPDLRLIVMSATLLSDEGGDNKLLQTLGGEEQCLILASEGRQYPIDIQCAKNKGYLPLGVLMKDRKGLVKTMTDAVEDGLRMAPHNGDVLAFLPGARECQLVAQELTSMYPDIDSLPLYGSMPKDKQDAVLYPTTSTRRRVIVSSPIAEASLTLPRVTCVVDSGLRREPRCDTDTGMPRLVTTRCSKASATQRAGRAGRIQAGICLRIYTESEYDQRFLDQSPPEISNTDLLPTLLLLSDWGCTCPSDIYEIPFVDPPEEAALMKAYETLVFLEALDKTSDKRYILTPLGRAIAALPTHPRLATAIERAATGTSREALAAAVMAGAIIDDDGGGPRGRRDTDMSQRIFSLLENSVAKKAVLQYAERMSNKAKEAVLYYFKNPDKIREVTNFLGEALLPGFVDLVAERKGDASYGGSTYMLSLGRSARLDDIRDSPDYLVVTETSTSDDGIARIRSFASIPSESLYKVAKESEVVFTVPSRGHEVRARRSLIVGSLELSSTPLPAPSSDRIAEVLLDTIRSLGGVHVALVQSIPPDKRAKIQQLRERVKLAISSSCPSDWPSCFSSWEALEREEGSPDDVDTLEQLVEPWLASAGSLKGLDLVEILTGSFTTDQNIQLDREFPLKIEAPDGTRIPIQYSNGVPMASAKLQQFFGTTESPSVGPPQSRTPVSLSLLSPAGKELAQTVDLPFFWKETYPSIRAEMRGRYAKHPWPEDPMNATPSRQTKKQLAAVGGDDESMAGSTQKKKKGSKRKKRR